MKKFNIFSIVFFALISMQTVFAQSYPNFLTYPFVKQPPRNVTHPWWYNGTSTTHYAVDYAGVDDGINSTNDQVVAAASGTVEVAVQTGYNDGCGTYIKIDHGNDFETLYYHMIENSLLVSTGDDVYQGQVIGRIGNTGNSTANHLHFEVRGPTNGSYSNTGKYDPYDIYDNDKGEYIPSTMIMGSNYLWTTDPPSYNIIEAGDYENSSVQQDIADKFSSLLNNNCNIGYPHDNGGTPFVHEWWGVYIQDFYGENNGFNNPHTALILKTDETGVCLIKEGFRGVYMSNNFSNQQYGPQVLGAPTDDENDTPGYTIQHFDNGYMTYQENGSNDKIIRVYDNNDNLLLDVAFVEGAGGGLFIPQNLSAQAISNSEVYLIWEDDYNISEVEYKIYRDNNLITTTSNTSYTDTNLDSVTTYYYQVLAYYNAAESARTDSISVTTISDPGGSNPSTFPMTLQAEDMDGPVDYLTGSVRLTRPNKWFLFDRIDFPQKGLIQYEMVVKADSVVNSTWPLIAINGCSQGNVSVDSTEYKSLYFIRYQSSPATDYSVEINLYGADSSSVIVDKLMLSYLACPELVVSAEEISLGADTSGVLSQTFSISNSGNDTLSGNLSIDSPFYLSSSNIDVAPSGNTSYTVSINLDTLALGTYSDTIFVDTEYENEQIIVSVSKSGNVSSTDFYFSDNFNRSSLGPNWTTETVSPATVGMLGDNYMKLDAPSGSAKALLSVPNSNLTEATVSFWLDNGGSSRANNATIIYIGYVDDQNCCYVHISEDNYESSRQKVEIRKVVNGQSSLLASTGGSFSLANGVYQFSAIADTFRFKNIQNGTSINLQATASPIQFAGKVGFYANEETSYIDDFEVSGSDSTAQAVTKSMVSSVDSLNFGSDLDTLSFVLSNTGNISNSWTVAESPNTSWMSLISDTSGTISAGDSLQLSLIVDRQGLADTTYYSSLVVTSDADTNTVVISIEKITPPAPPDPPPPAVIFDDWNRRAKLTIDNTKISGSSDLTNFPVMLTDDCLPSDIFTYANSDGGDIRFSADSLGEDELAREIVCFSDPDIEIWVNIPTINHGEDTPFYIWYGNSSASDYSATDSCGTNFVWQDYTGVYHFQGSLNSSDKKFNSEGTASRNLSEGNTPSNTTGFNSISNGAYSFNGPSHEYLELGNESDFDPGTSPFMIQCWFKSNQRSYLISKKQASGNVDYFILMTTDDHYPILQVSVGADENKKWAVGNSNVDNGSWHLLTGVRDGNNLYIYQDGSCVGSGSGVSSYSIDSGEEVWIARLEGGYFTGQIDEVRIINGSVKSSGWIATEYANQNSPSTFVSAGSSVPLSKRALPGQKEIQEVLPAKFNLYQNYPNPFNPTTQIVYDLPEDAHVKLTIYDVLGRQVATLVNTNQSAGEYVVEWTAMTDDGLKVSAGIYFYSLKANNFKDVKKMLVIQ